MEVGTRFGRLTVVEAGLSRETKHGRRRADRCQCECGRVVVVDRSNLRSGNSKSCGCSKWEALERTRRSNGLRAAAERLTTHGLSKHPHYNRWYNMIQRCQHEQHYAYRDYGGRGIRIAPEWQDPAVFLHYADTVMGPCPPGYSLDRIDNEGHYEPGNVRWASRTDQARNRRKARPRSR